MTPAEQMREAAAKAANDWCVKNAPVMSTNKGDRAIAALYASIGVAIDRIIRNLPLPTEPAPGDAVSVPRDMLELTRAFIADADPSSMVLPALDRALAAPPAPTPPDHGVARSLARSAIMLERRRQIEGEHWTAAHDDKHENGELLCVAAMYYQNASRRLPLTFRDDGAPTGWPWDRRWWKPKNRTSDLIRAGALCMAEDERLRRKGKDASVRHVEQRFSLILDALCETNGQPTPSGDRCIECGHNLAHVCPKGACALFVAIQERAGIWNEAVAWQTMESAPLDQRPILARNVNSGKQMICWRWEGSRTIYTDGLRQWVPTHWQPFASRSEKP